MKFSFSKTVRFLFLGGLLTVSCLGMAVTGFAAKAFEYAQVLQGSYVHTVGDEFYVRNTNLYNDYYGKNGWGEVIVREESGRDGTVRRYYMIGDVKHDNDDNFVLNVKRMIVQKLDNSGNIIMNNVTDGDYDINLYHRMDSGVKLEWARTNKEAFINIDGEYVTSVEYPLMSGEAAMYILEKFMNNTPSYQDKLQGVAMQLADNGLSESHVIKLIEHHRDHIVTLGTYEVTAGATILEYDIVTDKWKELQH